MFKVEDKIQQILAQSDHSSDASGKFTVTFLNSKRVACLWTVLHWEGPWKKDPRDVYCPTYSTEQYSTTHHIH